MEKYLKDFLEDYQEEFMEKISVGIPGVITCGNSWRNSRWKNLMESPEEYLEESFEGIPARINQNRNRTTCIIVSIPPKTVTDMV